MSLVEIARFSDGEAADIAVSFLRRHGVKAVRPRRNSPWAHMALGEATIFAEADQAETARRLLQRVLAGEFADHDPTSKSGKGWGAALSRSILPAADYRPPNRWAVRAPLLLVLGVFFVILVFRLVSGVFREGMG